MHQDQTEDSPSIRGESEAIKEVIRRIDRLAPAASTVLITGETGVGKDLVAQALHAKSKRKDKNFEAVNCARFTEQSLEGELFGHEKGAFTDADFQHIGLFEQNDGGTIFLDEIGEMSMEVQAKLLRILDGNPFKRVGGEKYIKVDVRIIAATNVNLRQAVSAGKFRADVYYRLYVGHIPIPPLRDRRKDIPDLVNKFIPDLSKKNEITVPDITPKALIFLENADWPGNVRELANVIERSIIFAQNKELGLKDVQAAYLQPNEDSPASDYLTLLSTFISDLEAYFQNQGWLVNIQDLKGAIEGAIIQATGQYQQLKDSQPTPQHEGVTPTQDDSLSTPSSASAWVEEFQNLLPDTQGRKYRPQNIERTIDTFVALIEERDGLKLNHLKKDMPYYKNRYGKERQYASVELLRGMYKDTIKPILESKVNEGLFKDKALAVVQNDINKTVIRQLCSLLQRANPQLQKANEAIENLDGARTPQPTRS